MNTKRTNQAADQDQPTVPLITPVVLNNVDSFVCTGNWKINEEAPERSTQPGNQKLIDALMDRSKWRKTPGRLRHHQSDGEANE